MAEDEEASFWRCCFCSSDKAGNEVEKDLEGLAKLQLVSLINVVFPADSFAVAKLNTC